VFQLKNQRPIFVIKRAQNTTIKLSILELIKQLKIVLKVVADCQKEGETLMTFIINNYRIIYA
jgi:hypothetical protein